MNITYLIGNGFDLNLGLHTKYSDFIEWLNNEESSDKASIQELQKSIDEYCKGKKDAPINWSDTEEAFGLFTYLFKGRSNGDEEIDEDDNLVHQELLGTSLSYRHWLNHVGNTIHFSGDSHDFQIRKGPIGPGPSCFLLTTENEVT